jgi:hypothetical protein
MDGFALGEEEQSTKRGDRQNLTRKSSDERIVKSDLVYFNPLNFLKKIACEIKKAPL